MSGFLAMVARRALGLDALVRPRLPSRFEDDPGWSFADDEGTDVPAARGPEIRPSERGVDPGRAVTRADSAAGPVGRDRVEPAGPIVAPPSATNERPVRPSVERLPGVVIHDEHVIAPPPGPRPARALEWIDLAATRVETFEALAATVPSGVRERLIRDGSLVGPPSLGRPARPESVTTGRGPGQPRDARPDRGRARGAASRRDPEGGHDPSRDRGNDPSRDRGHDPAPTIEVTIGRVEVRAAPPPRGPARSSSGAVGPALDLEAYLRARSGRA